MLLKKFSTFDTWSEFEKTRGNKDVYRNAVTAMEQDLARDLDLAETQKGAFLDPDQVPPL